MQRITPYLIVLLASLFTACRRDLWVYTDQFSQVELTADWNSVRTKPDGVTWWFMKDDHSGYNRSFTTGQISYAILDIPLARGQYSVAIFDYSPPEYSHQEFVGMTHIDSALVHQLPAADQPGVNQHLYGDYAVPDYMATSIPRYTPTGMYQVGAEPEFMNADALHNKYIDTGGDGELVRWERDGNYGAKQNTITLRANPHAIVWSLMINVYVKGLQYMSGVRGSIAGLSDGCWLGTQSTTSTPCLQALDTWSVTSSTDGYISTHALTFGVPNSEMPPSFGTGTVSSLAPSRAETTIDNPDLDPSGNSHTLIGERLQLNLQFLLRDGSTVMNYHYDLGPANISVNEDNLTVIIDIPADYTPDGGGGGTPGGGGGDGPPDLPYVDSVDGAGFDADVTPWADGGTADETM